MPELQTTSLRGDAALVAYYPFNGNSTDVKNGKNGTDTDITYVAAKFSGGADFNGTSSDIDVAAFSSDIFASGGTAVGWLYPDAVADGKSIIHFDDGNTALLSLTNTSGSTCSLGFTHYAAATDGIWRSTNRDLEVGRWFHIAVGYDRTTGQDANPVLYVNSASVGVTETQTPADPLRTSIDQLNFGSDGAGAAFANIKLEDWAFFSRVLTAGEIELLFREQAGNFGYFM